ncbi:tetratricopeptide repeat protein [Prochlorococcus sp. MIT 1341]|uniref:tetratricopeptide repeat protein n=1 Tax=Prochlorococcus sp. MIT 1341 TaxID=3096221 RepID=UPI002A756592|nr:tetratricopeptide repeat protein [Prochlorococcus sp. MIT 1341]
MNDNDYWQLYQKIADVSYKHRNYRKAGEFYLRALNINKNDQETIVSLAYSKLSEKDYDGTILACTKLLELNPKNYGSLCMRGVCRYAKEDFIQSLNDYNKAIEIHHDWATFYRYIGYFKYILDDYEGAIKAFDEVIDMGSIYYYDYFLRGICTSHTGDNLRAYYYVTKAIEFALDYRAVYLYLFRSRLLISLNDYPGALTDANKAVDINPDKHFCYINRASIHVSLKNKDLVKEDVNKAMSIGVKYGSTYSYLGNILDEHEDFKGAIDAYTKAIEMDSEDDMNFYWRGICKYKLGDYEGSISDFMDSIDLEDTDSSFEVIPDVDYFQPEEVRLYVCCKLMKIFPKKLVGYRVACRLLWEKNELELAIELLSKYMSFKPNNTSALWARAGLLFELKRYSQSIQFINKLIKNIKSNRMLKSSYLLKADNYFCLGEFKKAVKYYSKGLEMKKPNWSYYNIFLSEKYLKKGASYLNLQIIDKSLKELKTSLKLNSEFENIMKIIDILCQFDQNNNALIICNKAIKLNPRAKDSILERKGDILFDKGKYDQAITAYSDISSKYLNLFEIYEKMGDCLFKLGKYDDAIDNYSMSIKENPMGYYKKRSCYQKRSDAICQSIKLYKK